jgi:replicative superfamily II helicase
MFTTDGTSVEKVYSIPPKLITVRKALFILPFVSIVEEKMESMERFADDLNFIVEGYYGHHGTLYPAVPPGNQLMIATIEKASAIINNLLFHNRIGELGLIVRIKHFANI